MPNLIPPESISVGIWGQRLRGYLRQYKDPIYTGMLLSGKLDAHLAEIDRAAPEMYERLVTQMAQAEGITEELKAIDQMAWVGWMNNIRDRAMEVVLNELVYV